MSTLSKTRLLAASLSLAVCTAHGSPISPVTIQDTYQGSNDHGYGDRIGGQDYEVERMEASVYGSGSVTRINVKIFTYFNQALDQYGTQFGDLFLSTDGWHPNGAAPYTADDYSNGEDWEFVFDTSENRLYGGAFSILRSEQTVPFITMSHAVVRDGQEVLRGSGGTALDPSSWVSLANASAGSGQLGYIDYDIGLSALGLGNDFNLGLKWGMSCANDTIEGLVAHSVPEPPVWAALLAGLLAWTVTGRRRR